jgi:sulfate permease, SulP family
MPFSALGRQLSAGLIVGVSVVIYSITYGALLFAGTLSPFVGYAITGGLIAGAVGALYGWLTEERNFIAGPDSNTVSVLASTLAVMGSVGTLQATALESAVAMIFCTSMVCAAAFYIFARPQLSSLVRYIPYSVMAGFLASTGWLMASGALNIISGTPLTVVGLSKLANDPVRPELAFGLVVTVTLFALSRRLPSSVLVPLVAVTATIAANLLLVSGWCAQDTCPAARWMFNGLQETPWLPPWQLDLAAFAAALSIENVAAMFVVAFVGILTIVLSLASLELTFEKEFELNRALKAHAGTALVTGALSGFIGLISLSRTALNKTTGGGAIAGSVAAAMCVATLFGAGELVGYISRGALGGLILYLGLGMLKQWLWDQRRSASPLELIQIVAILALTANYGFLVGFVGGILIACIIFVVTYSQIPIADLASDLARFASPVVRPQNEVDMLRARGARTRVYRLSGYVFFGSASRIDSFVEDLDPAGIDGIIIDFSNVSGIDRSAVSVFQRILRRHTGTPVRFQFVSSGPTAAALQVLTQDPLAARNLSFFPSLDRALEAAEERILAGLSGESHVDGACFAFLEIEADRTLFRGYCERKQVAADGTLAREGDLSNEVFFLESGSLEITKTFEGGRSARLAKLRPGAMTGELAFYTGAGRSASIHASEASSVQVLHRAALTRMRAEHPELATKFDHMVIRSIAASLTRTNQMIATLS